MAERTDSTHPHVERSNELVASPPTEQHQPPARTRARRSWYSRPANLASPSSPCLNRGPPPPGPVYPRTPLRADTWSTPEAAKHPHKPRIFGRRPDVRVQSLDAVVEEERRTWMASESGSVREEEGGVRSYTPDYSPPEATSFWEQGFVGGSPLEGGESGALVQSPATPTKIRDQHDGTPTKTAEIISGLLSSPARVQSSPGQLLVTKTCRRWWFIGHNYSKCKRSHGAHDKKPVTKKEQSTAEAQGSRTTRLTRVFMGRVAKRSATQKGIRNRTELS